MPSSIPPFSLRLPDKLMEKIRTLAEINKRSVNKEIEFLAERYIADYEKKHGPIKVEEE